MVKIYLYGARQNVTIPETIMKYFKLKNDRPLWSFYETNFAVSPHGLYVNIYFQSFCRPDQPTYCNVYLNCTAYKCLHLIHGNEFNILCVIVFFFSFLSALIFFISLGLTPKLQPFTLT